MTFQDYGKSVVELLDLGLKISFGKLLKRKEKSIQPL